MNAAAAVVVAVFGGFINNYERGAINAKRNAHAAATFCLSIAAVDAVDDDAKRFYLKLSSERLCPNSVIISVERGRCR